jgi:ATP-binding cassette subfamily C protein LapB
MIGKFLTDIKRSLAPDRVVRVLTGPALTLLVIGVVSNVISIFTSLFALLVYDKVFPNNGLSTLIVLTTVVCALLAIDVALRMLRMDIINRALHSAPSTVNLSDLRDRFRIFGKAQPAVSRKSYLEITLTELNQLQPNDVKTASLTVDLPFVILLLVAIFLIAGSLVVIPLIAVAILMVLIASTHSKFKSATNLLESERRTTIETLAFLSRGTDWLFGAGGWKWLTNKELEARQQIATASASVAYFSNIRQICYQLVTQLVSVATLFFGFFLYQSNVITVGAIIATYMLTNRVLTPIGNISQMITADEAELNKSEQINTDRIEPSIEIHLSDHDWRINLVNLSLTYEGRSSPSFSVGNIQIQQGERIAIVGPSGSGKTTFAKILCGAVSGFEGALMWNQLPVSSIRQESWEKFCTYIPQTPWFGKGSLFDQIRLGDQSISDSDIAAAITAAGIQGLFIADQKTISGEGFSAGQLQLLGLLRCLTRQSRLLILDEPTNFLDEETEQKIMAAIIDRYQNATILLITHRKSLLKYMDRAIVIEKGTVARDGKIIK